MVLVGGWECSRRQPNLQLYEEFVIERNPQAYPSPWMRLQVPNPKGTDP